MCCCTDVEADLVWWHFVQALRLGAMHAGPPSPTYFHSEEEARRPVTGGIKRKPVNFQGCFVPVG